MLKLGQSVIFLMPLQVAGTPHREFFQGQVKVKQAGYGPSRGTEAHGVVLISVSLAVSHWRTYTATPQRWGKGVTWSVGLFASFHRYSLCLPVEGRPGRVNLAADESYD